MPRSPTSRQRGTSVVLVEQDLVHAMSVADRAYCFQEGRVSLTGRPQELTPRRHSRRLFRIVERMLGWIDTLLQGVLLGGLYSLYATGLSVIFGIMRLVNLAHGDLIVLGGVFDPGGDQRRACRWSSPARSSCR